MPVLSTKDQDSRDTIPTKNKEVWPVLGQSDWNKLKNGHPDGWDESRLRRIEHSFAIVVPVYCGFSVPGVAADLCLGLQQAIISDGETIFERTLRD